MDWTFTEPGILDRLERADDSVLDEVPFGIIAMTVDGVVMSYNAAESRLAGLSPAKVVGRHFSLRWRRAPTTLWWRSASRTNPR